MKLLIPFFIILQLSFDSCFAEDLKIISITTDKPFTEINHNGKTIKIERALVQNNKIKTKPCPPFCIKPMTLAPDVETFAELELLSFLSNEVKNDKGYLVDSRLREYFEKETIPGSINIPFTLFSNNQTEEVLKILGVKEENALKDYSQTKTLCFYCEDSVCDEANRAILALLKLDYPAEKLKYYRGGLNAWKNLSLTTVHSNLDKPDSAQIN